MKRFGPRHAATLVVFAGLLIAINFAIAPRRRAVQTKNCEFNLKQITVAMMQYVRDYDEKYPVTARWADDLKPYASNTQTVKEHGIDYLFHCPTSGASYAYNNHLEGFSIAQTDATNVWIFDAEAGQTQRNFSGDGKDWPASPIHEKYPIWGNHLITGDGSVKFAESPPPASAFLLKK